MQSYPPNDMDGQSITSFSSTTAPSKTGLRPRGRGPGTGTGTHYIPHPTTQARPPITTPPRREPQPTHHQHSHPPPPTFTLHPSISSTDTAPLGQTTTTRRDSRGGNRSSATWTSSSDGGGNNNGCDLANLSDTDDVQDRSGFVAEYNRLAGKHGIRPFASDEYVSSQRHRESHHHNQKRTGWFSRTFLRMPSTASVTGDGDSGGGGVRRATSHKRSVSDLAIQIMQPILKRDSLRGEDLQSLVRLCGKSILYLPSEYAPGSLVLATCLRATAQYLVQHAADTRGVFRIPGSVRVVSALYDYYCAEGNVDDITSTIRCPNLPQHIKATTHDVASTFKRLLSGLPGGILGSLPLLDALVAIHSQLKGDPEVTKTKQTKLRARLIALAIGSVKSQFRRELICAVFGLLCLIGRAAETAPREDEHGRPLPTADLMGYSALGIVFGPLLVSDLLNSYTMRLAHPSVGLVLFPVTPPNTRRERRKSRVPSGEEGGQSGLLTVDKIHVANGITEMLITHWRDVVKHMRSLDILRACATGGGGGGGGSASVAHFADNYSPAGLRPSASESFVIRKPAEWSGHRSPRGSLSVPKFVSVGREDMSESPVPPSPTPEARRGSRSRMCGTGVKEGSSRSSSLVVQRQRPKLRVRSSSGSRVVPKTSLSLLSPTAEEPASLHEFEMSPGGMSYVAGGRRNGYNIPPLMCYAAPMEVPREREDQEEAGMGGGLYRDEAEDDEGVEDPGGRGSEELLINEMGGEKPGRRPMSKSIKSIGTMDDTPAQRIRRRAYSQISASAKGASTGVFRSSLPEPSTPPYKRGSFRGGETRSSIPKPSTATLDKRKRGGASEDQDMPAVSMSESKGASSDTRSAIRLGMLTDTDERVRTNEGDVSASESQRPEKEKRHARRLLKGSRSSHSSYSLAVRGEDVGVGASDVEGSLRREKGSIFRHLHRSERSVEAGVSEEIQPPVPAKNKMRLSFHLRKSASESRARSQERRRLLRSGAGGRSENQHHGQGQEKHGEEVDGRKSRGSQILVPRRGRGRSSRTSTSQVPSVEVPLPIVENVESVRSPTRPGRGGSNTTGAPTSPNTPSRIPVPHRQAHSGGARSRGNTKGKERESVAGEGTSNVPGPTRINKTPRDDNLAREDNKPSVTPTTPPRANTNKDVNRVQSPVIPTRTSSVNRYSKSSVGRTPFPVLPTTPNMESPSRRPRGPTGSSVKAMAAMFENNSGSSVSPLKPPVPVFGVPTAIVQRGVQEGVGQGVQGGDRGVVGEYTVNLMSPSRGGGNDKKGFSFSPVKVASEGGSQAGLVGVRSSTEEHSEQSWVTVVPCSGGGEGGHGAQDVEVDNVVVHPDPEIQVFWTIQDGKPKETGDEDSSLKTQEGAGDQDGSVRITRPLASERSNSEGSDKGESSRGRRRVRSTVSRGSKPQRRVVASMMTPPRLGKIVTASLSGLRSVDKGQMKGSPAEPEVDMSTAVASLNSRSQDSAEKGLQYRAGVDSDLDRVSPEMQAYGHQVEVEGSQDHVSFLPPVRAVTFSDLESSFDLSTSQKADQTPILHHLPTTSVEPHVSSPAMEVPYSSLMATLPAAAETASTPSVPGRQGPPSGSTSRKITGASSSGQLSPPIPIGVRGSSSNAALHIQIGKLQRALYSKTEEVKHLRQQLEMKESTIYALRKRGIEAESECKVWRQRAEVAETRVAVFQRVTAKMRGRRVGAVGVEGENEGRDWDMGEVEGREKSRMKGKGKEKEVGVRQLSGDMHTEDEAAVADRIRAAIHGGGPGDVDGKGAGQGLDGEDEVWADEFDEDYLEGLGPGVWVDKGGETVLVPLSGTGHNIGSSGPGSGEYLHHRQLIERGITGVKSGIESHRPSPGPSSTRPLSHRQLIERGIIGGGPVTSPGYSSPASVLTNKSHRHQKKSSSSNYFDYYLRDKHDTGNQAGDFEDDEKDKLPYSHGLHRDEGEVDEVADNYDMGEDARTWNREDMDGEDGGDGPIDVDIDDDNRSYTTASTNRTTKTTGSAMSEVEDGGESVSLSSAMHVWIRAVERGERAGGWESEGGDDRG